jgi:hypothetical protein
MDFKKHDPEATLPMIYGFNDYLIGIFDLFEGKIKAFPELSCISTKIPAFEYMRSYNPLSCLTQSEGVLQIRDIIAQKMTQKLGMKEQNALRSSSDLIRKRLCELTGGKLTNLHEFWTGRHFSEKEIVIQFRFFNRMFHAKTQEHAKSAELIRAANAYSRAIRGLSPIDGKMKPAPEYNLEKLSAPPIREEEVATYKYLDINDLRELPSLPKGATRR